MCKRGQVYKKNNKQMRKKCRGFCSRVIWGKGHCVNFLMTQST